MLKLAKSRGITPSAVVMDAWYSSLDNLKTIRSHGWIWVTTLRKNSIVNRNVRLETLETPKKDFRFIYMVRVGFWYSSLWQKTAALIT